MGGRIRLAIEAPQNVLVLRQELLGSRLSRDEWDAPAELACKETA
jgi:sRNA-binding carbon storage regulator CsrA